uniref:MORN repeat-containing protein 3 n=1 Tax=Strigamia maritima TaxID=126957 RepID=T1ITY5_STRMM
MPFRRNRTVSVPKWEKANLTGLRHLVFTTRGDEYRGEWKDNLKHGNGHYKWKNSGAIYEGTWENNKKNGFGVLSVPAKDQYLRKYVGHWKDNKFHGYGTLSYTRDEYYEGEFLDSSRHGWGKMHWANGDVYEGEWQNDKRHGRGMLDIANGQRVECHWFKDKKVGPGKHYFPLTGQLLRGYWTDDVCRSGTIEDLDWRSAPNKTPFPIPKVSKSKSKYEN